jgi:hypothetical protein
MLNRPIRVCIICLGLPYTLSSRAEASPTRSASPFWRPPPRDSLSSSSKRNIASPPGHGSGLVVGAAYSHADMLKFDSLYAELPLYLRERAFVADVDIPGTPTPLDLEHHPPPHRPRFESKKLLPLQRRHLERTVPLLIRATSTFFLTRTMTGRRTKMI